MTTEENMIPIEPYLKDFKQYLDANSRCILSAKFGDGKSYFISSFIKEYSGEYLFIPIYPVNYQVMDNKDIFELIKRDILIRLLSNKDININEIELSNASLFYSYFMNKSEDAILDVIDLIPKINVYGVDISISSVIKKIKNIKDKFDKYKEQFKSANKTSELYITKFDSLKGSIYEFDTISQLICDITCEYRKLNPMKKVVLIIEDLDRIDPEHIFRILNIFSAHFDRYTPGIDEFEKTCGDNKFCLDKIITVCDLNNIRNIYSHVYGEKTDFTGYISKFSNNKQFDYSLKENLKEYIINLFNKNLLKHSILCEILADLILNKLDDSSKQNYNLRLIKERIKKSESQIRDYIIPLEKGLNGLSLPLKSDYTHFLALLKVFKIDYSTFIITNNNDQFRKCIACLVGPYWALAEKRNGNLSLTFNKDNIICTYDLRNGYRNDKVSTAFEYTIENKIIKDIKIRFDDYHQIGLKVYDTLGAITDYLFKSAIL